jgi:hypothetical protein
VVQAAVVMAGTVEQEQVVLVHQDKVMQVAQAHLVLVAEAEVALVQMEWRLFSLLTTAVQEVLELHHLTQVHL